MSKLTKQEKKKRLELKLKNFFDEHYLDIQGMSPSSKNSLDEAYLARMFTKMSVSAATFWWSFIEVKDFFEDRARVRRKRQQEKEELF